MTRKRLILVTAVVAMCSSNILGQATIPLPNMERILLPITIQNVNGAFGSKWSTAASIFIDVDPQVQQYVLPLQGCDPPSCEPIVGTARRTLPLGFFPTQPGEPSGSLLYVQRTISDHVFVSLHLTQGLNGSDTSLPVVREHSFFQQPFQIIDVPDAGAARRLTLRVYGIDPDIQGQIRVRVFGVSETVPLRDNVYSLSNWQHNYTTATWSVPVRPPSVDVQYYAPVSSPPSESLRFEVQSLTQSMPIWAFVSVTDNTTQAVTLRMPQ